MNTSLSTPTQSRIDNSNLKQGSIISDAHLSRRYILALSLIAALSITAFLTLRAAISAQTQGAAVVNVAGRQRMLSQRISRFALLLAVTDNPADSAKLRETLVKDLDLFEASHEALLNGGTVRGISAGESLTLPGSPSPAVHAMYFDAPMTLDSQVKSFVSEARAILQVPEAQYSVQDAHLQTILAAAASELLTSLNTVTGQYQKESEAAIARLQILESVVLGITLMALLAEALFIFRPMVSQIVKRNEKLEETIHLVEQQNEDIERQSRAIRLRADVTRHLSKATDPRQLAMDIVEQVRSSFQYYHVQIYFLDALTGDLVMTAATGKAGATLLASNHSVQKGRGFVGRAAETNTVVLVPDVAQMEDWLPNSLLPETRSEAAFPISLGNQVLGVLDVQHNIVNGLSEEYVEILQSLAGQVAISLRNARTLAESRAKADLETLVNTIGQKIQRTTSVEDTLQTAIREIGLALGASRVKVKIQSNHQNDGNMAGQN